MPLLEAVISSHGTTTVVDRLLFIFYSLQYIAVAVVMPGPSCSIQSSSRIGSIFSVKPSPGLGPHLDASQLPALPRILLEQLRGPLAPR